MTDTATAPAAPTGELRGFYDAVTKSIAEHDAKLDAGSESAGKRKFTNALVENAEEEWKGVADDIVSQMAEFPPDVLAGVLYGISRHMFAAYKEKVDNYITEQVALLPVSEEEKLSDEERKEISDARSELFKRQKAIVDMADTFQLTTPENGGPWPLAKRRGASGRRGQRALTSYVWTVDGNGEFDGSDSVKGTALYLGFETQKEFTELLRNEPNNIDTKNPPDKISVNINGKLVEAEKKEESEENENAEPGEEESED